LRLLDPPTISSNFTPRRLSLSRTESIPRTSYFSPCYYTTSVGTKLVTDIFQLALAVIYVLFVPGFAMDLADSQLTSSRSPSESRCRSG